MRPGGGRAKGAAFERTIVHLLRTLFPGARRRAMQARGGREGADIDLTPGFWIECGHGARMNAAEKWAQAKADRDRDCAGKPFLAGSILPIPIAITRRNGEPILATLSLDDLLKLLRTGKENPFDVI